MNRAKDDTTTKIDAKYPSLDEVETIPLPSFDDAFRCDVDAHSQAPGLNRAPSSERPGSKVIRHPHQDVDRSSQRSVSSNGSRNRPREKSESSRFPVSSSSDETNKRPSIERLKSSDLLDTKPAALTRPAASKPGVVEVNHAPYYTTHEHQRDVYYGEPSSYDHHQHSRGPRSSDPRQSRHAPAARSFRQMELEVSPGVFLPLHGSEETYCALREDRLCATYCLVCEAPLFCVEYAAQVLCPLCRVVSPVFTHQEERRGRNSGGGYYYSPPAPGVGLGMTVDEYDRTWAEEEQQRAMYHRSRSSRACYDRY